MYHSRTTDHQLHQPIHVVESGGLGPAIVQELIADEYPTRLAINAKEAADLATQEPPALVIIGELDSPTETLTLLRTIRRSSTSSPWHPDVPVIIINSEGEHIDLLRAFDAGADDFMFSPTSYPELRARLQATLRRAANPAINQVLQVGPLKIDTATYTATLHGRQLDLRQMEYDLLVHLAHKPTRVFRTPEILQTIWAYPEPGHVSTLDSHASHLRRKLNAVGGRWIINVQGRGYRLI